MICEVIQKNTEGNMDILTSGPSVPNPANILGSEEMQFLLRTLATDYSHIVIDSPPVLYFADSTILSTFVNAVVLVARDKISSRNNVLEAKKMLMNVSAKVIGIVLNGVPLKNSKYYGYKYYKNLPASSDEDVQGSLRIT